MLKHLFITAIRNLSKRRFFSLINIAGLSIGIATFLILMNYVDYEFSYDDYLPEVENIYRIDYYEFQGNEPVIKNARTHTGLSSFLKENIPEVKYVAKAYNENCLLFNDKAKGHQKGVWADSTFFNVFEVNLLEGERNKALVAPYSMAISKSLANVYFGKENPIGKRINFNEHIPFTVTAVFDDVPDNAAVKFNFVISWSTLELLLWAGPKKGDFTSPWTYTYVKLQPQTDVNKLNASLEKIATDNVVSLRQKNLKGKYSLRPLKEIHFTKGMAGEQEPGRSKALLYALICVAIFILIAAWINYLNLSLAQTFQRAEEIMVRKVYGASIATISSQFIMEALIINTVALLAGIGTYFFFVQILSGYLSASFYKSQELNLNSIGYFACITLVTIVAAIFPARMVARYKPAFILKRQYNVGSNKNLLRNGLVVFQLLLAIFTIGCTIIANRQITFMQSFDLGFNTSQTISLMGPASRNIDSLRYQRFLAFRNELLANNNFLAGTASMNIPGEELRYHDESIRLSGSNNEKKQTFWISTTDDGYLKTFSLKLLAGRNIEEKDKGKNCLINLSAAKAFGFKTAVQAINAEFVTSDNKKIRVAGVIQDYHQESLKKKVEPVLFYFGHPYEFGYYTFRVNSANREAALNFMQQAWKKHYPDDPFSFYFMDNFFARQYEDDELFGKLLTLFSAMAVIVASLGLLGLASLTVLKRTKEIGVRKVVGASVLRILLLLSKDYIRLVLIAFLIVLPIFYYAIDEWLKVFSYRIELQFWMFIMPGIIVTTIAWCIISLQSLKAARTNPVKSLRTE